jgi:hypothetical protein
MSVKFPCRVNKYRISSVCTLFVSSAILGRHICHVRVNPLGSANLPKTRRRLADFAPSSKESALELYILFRFFRDRRDAAA